MQFKVKSAPLSAPLAPLKSPPSPPSPKIESSKSGSPTTFKPQMGLTDLSSDDVLKSIEHSIESSSSESLSKRSSLLKDLSPTKIESLSKSLETDLDKGQEMVEHLDETESLLHGDISHENLEGTEKLLQGVSDLSHNEEVQKVTGKLIEPLKTVDSALSTKEAFKKMWDDPNIENLADLTLSAKESIDHLIKTIDSVPGGHLLVKALENLAEGIAPGLKTAQLDKEFVELVIAIKNAAHDHSMKHIATAVLETVQFTASIGVATGLPLVSQISKAVVAGVDLVEGLMNIDYSSLAHKASKMLSGFGSWLGLGSET